jgi:hypothetical protein
VPRTASHVADQATCAGRHTSTLAHALHQHSSHRSPDLRLGVVGYNGITDHHPHGQR